MLITAQRMTRLEIWSGYQCAGGARLAVLAGLTACIVTGTISGEDRLVLTVRSLEDSVASIADRRVLRVVESDTVFDEWRIADWVTETGSGLTTITCVGIDGDLGVAALISQVDASGGVRFDFDAIGLKASAVIDTFVLPALAAAGLTWVARGTIDQDQTIDVAFAWDTPLAVLRRIAESLGLELQLRRNGTAGYYVDLLVTIGGTAAVADLRYTKNLLGLTRTRTLIGVSSRLYPQGAAVDGYAATMANARWRVASVAVGSLVLEDPAGGDGPIAFNDQLNGLRLVRVDGTTEQITDSEVSPQRVYVASTTGFAAGDFVGVRVDATTDLTYLESPADVAALGRVVGVLERSDIPGTENVVPNPACRDWPAGTLPVGWAAVGAPTLSKNTAAPYVRTAGASIRVQASASGQGVVTAAGRVRPSATKPYGAGIAGIWIVSGKARVEFVVTKADASTVVLPAAPAVAYSGQLGVWVDLGISGEDLNALTAVSVAVRVVAHAGAAEFYVDAAQVTNTPAQEPFVEGSGGTKLWQAANEHLKRQASAMVSYAAGIVDLARIDTSAWGDDCAIVQGGSVRITDARAGVVSAIARVASFERNYLVPGDARVTLASQPQDLVRRIASVPRADRARSGPASDGDFSGAPNERLGTTKYKAVPTIDAVEQVKGTYQYTFLCTARDPDNQRVRIGYRTSPATAPSQDYASPAPTFTALAAQPQTASIVVDRDIVDRLFEVWAEDEDGNRSFIEAVFLPAITAADAENAITSATFSTAFTGPCPGSFLRDTISWSETGPGGWTTTVEKSTDGGATYTAIAGTTSPIAHDALTNVGSGVAQSFTRQYRIRRRNSYNSIVDEDVTVSQTTNYSPC